MTPRIADPPHFGAVFPRGALIAAEQRVALDGHEVRSGRVAGFFDAITVAPVDRGNYPETTQPEVGLVPESPVRSTAVDVAKAIDTLHHAIAQLPSVKVHIATCLAAELRALPDWDDRIADQGVEPVRREALTPAATEAHFRASEYADSTRVTRLRRRERLDGITGFRAPSGTR